MHLQKSMLLALSTSVVITAGANVAQAISFRPIARIDIDSTNSGTIDTAAGFTSLDATGGNGSSVTVGGISYEIFSAQDDRNRTGPNDLTKDFVFDDGNNEAVGLYFGDAGDLPTGTYQVKLWSYDISAQPGDQIVGYRTKVTKTTGVVETLLPGTVGVDAVNPVSTFTFISDGVSAYDVFIREAPTGNDRTRLNAVELAVMVPEPSTFALSTLGLFSLGFVGWRRRRR